MTKSKIKILAVMSVLFITLMIIGAVLDLDISDSLCAGEHNFLALMAGVFGKLPAYLMLAFCFAVLFDYVKVNRDAYKKSVSIILFVLYFIAITASFVMAFYSAFDEITSKAKYIGVALGGVASLVTLYLLLKHDMSHLEELKKWAILTIIAVGIIIVLVALLKTVWGRARYNELLFEGASFTPWYIPNGVTGGHSFPSGHTALWGALFMLVPLVKIFDREGAVKVFILVAITNIMVGLFRILGGHHYLSDVTFAMAISFYTTFIVNQIGYNSDYSNKVLGTKNIFRHI